MNNKYEEIIKLMDEKEIICPMPGEWGTLYKMLPAKRVNGAGWEPGLPLILAAWDHTPLLPKMLRFQEHLDFALENGVIDQVHEYIFSLTDDQFLRES